MSPYIPVTTRVPTVKVPEGEWLLSKLSTGNLISIYAILFSSMVCMVFGLLFIVTIVLCEVVNISYEIMGKYLLFLVGVSILLAIPLYIGYLPKPSRLTVSTKVSGTNLSSLVNSAVSISLHNCGVVFKEKSDDNKEYNGSIYYNRFLRFSVYVSLGNKYAILKISDFGKKNESLVMCLQGSISRILEISDRLTPQEELLQRQRHQRLDFK